MYTLSLASHALKPLAVKEADKVEYLHVSDCLHALNSVVLTYDQHIILLYICRNCQLSNEGTVRYNLSATGGSSDSD